MVKIFAYLIFIMSFVMAGCVKETFDTNKLSKNSQLSPELAFPAIYGSVSFKELDNLSMRGNLSLIYTVDNFMNLKGSGDNYPVKPENFEMLRIDINARNGFPLKVGFQMSLLDSATNTIKGTVDATNILEAAPVDSNGKVTAAAETKTGIKFTKEFISSIPLADKVRFQFSFNTSNNGMNFVSISSDYRIFFKVALVFKPNIYLK
jgi:hypothetical protein